MYSYKRPSDIGHKCICSVTQSVCFVQVEPMSQWNNLKKYGSSSVVPNIKVEVATVVDHSDPETPRLANVDVEIKSSP